jgi:hypothetical protein
MPSHKPSVERILDRHALSQRWKVSAEQEMSLAKQELVLAKERKIQQAQAHRAALDDQVRSKAENAGNQLEESKRFLESILAREETEAREEQLKLIAMREKAKRETMAFERQHQAELKLQADRQKKADRELREMIDRAAATEELSKKRAAIVRSVTAEPVAAASPSEALKGRSRSSFFECEDLRRSKSPPAVGILPNILERQGRHLLGSVSPPPDVISRMQRQDAAVQSLPAFSAASERRISNAGNSGFSLPSEDEATVAAKRAREKEMRETVRSILEAQISIRHEEARQVREEDRAFASAFVAEGLRIADAMERKSHVALAEKKRRLRATLEDQLQRTRIVRKTFEITPKI